MPVRFWTPAEFFASLSRQPSGCWLWTGTCVRDGYGRLHHAGREMRAHRIAYEFARGAIPNGMLVCHRCDVPACANPDHLFLGTNAENMRDCVAKSRPARGERVATNKLTADQVREIRAACGSVPERGLRLRLARHYGVSWTQIDWIAKRRTWKHLP